MKRIVSALVLMLVAASVLTAQASSATLSSGAATMVSITSLLGYYGFTRETFNAGSDIVTKRLYAELSTFDADAYCIDTPEDFIIIA